MSHRTVALLAAVFAAAALGVAWWAERVLGLVPCALCLWERWPYRVVIAAGLLASVLTGRPSRAMVLGSALACAAAAGLAGLHVGVERQWWPSPLPECAAPSLGGGTIAERLARMPATPAKPCDEPTYLLPGVPVSMAAMNLLYALALGAFLATSAARRGDMR